jgi:hypothetical protein
MKRALFVSVVTLVLMVLLSGTVLAGGKPVRIFIGGPVDIPIDRCEFAVVQHVLSNKEYIKIFVGDHPAIVTGSVKARITRPDGAGIDVNISGPLFISSNSDGSMTFKLAGRSTIFLPDRPGLWLSSGPATVVINANGTTRTLNLPHNTQDLCPVLAALPAP